MAKIPRRHSHGFNMFEARELVDKEIYMNQISKVIDPLVYDESIERKDRRKRVWCAPLGCFVLPHVARDITAQGKRTRWQAERQRKGATMLDTLKKGIDHARTGNHKVDGVLALALLGAESP